ncbi:hypothetical protein HKCCD6035_02340 [Rhodobacterales bacterium HKCCD6035]|nr:hypothetical protein [Rhodobacterales bacterium HKCCD6035]
MEHAPVVVSVYDRPSHFKACIESLAQNIGAEQTTLFITSDGPKDDVSAEQVALVRDYIKTIVGFKNVFSFCPKENTLGKIKFSVYETIKSDFTNYIRTEDDNVFSPYALNYFNKGLELFAGDPQIHAICGYMFPEFPSQYYENIFLQCYVGWGVAFWRDKDIYPGFDEEKISKHILNDKYLFNKVNNILPHILPMTQLIVDKKLRAADVSRCNYMVKNDLVCVFPSVSIVRNNGHDGTGSHCGIDAAYAKQRIAEKDIQFDTLKPRKPKRNDERWVTSFFGGKKLILRNKILFSRWYLFYKLFSHVIKFFRG